MAVDLAGLLRAGDRRVRVRTNMEIYWDQAFLAAARDAATLRRTELVPDTCDLRFAGFAPVSLPIPAI